MVINANKVLDLANAQSSEALASQMETIADEFKSAATVCNQQSRAYTWPATCMWQGHTVSCLRPVRSRAQPRLSLSRCGCCVVCFACLRARCDACVKLRTRRPKPSSTRLKRRASAPSKRNSRRLWRSSRRPCRRLRMEARRRRRRKGDDADAMIAYGALVCVRLRRVRG